MAQPLLYGLHDREAAPYVPAGGWVLDTIALADNPAPTDYAALRGDINWIVRANWGYGSTGTIPLPENDRLYHDRLAHYVHNSKGAHIWIIGNEPNHEQERPNGVFITPARYAAFFVKARSLIKTINPNHHVLPAPCAPYHATPVDWLDYREEMLNLIADNDGCDGIGIHAYTRSSNPQDIHSFAEMQPPLEDQYSGFMTYLDQIELVPPAFVGLPFYITEFNELLEGGWDDRNTGVVQEAYKEIDSHNHDPLFPESHIHCLILYRWPRYDKWYIDGKQGVIDDFKAATGRGYTSPVGVTNVPDTTYLPFVPNQSTPTQPTPDLPPREWDERLTQRGVNVGTPALLQPGQKYWRVTKARWWDEKESQGRHHIYVEAQDDKGNPISAPFTVMWPNGSAPGQTNERSGFDAGNFPMSKSLNEFSVIMAGGGYPSERVIGIGMGANGNSGIHTSTGVVFQLATVRQAQPKPPTEQPAQPMPKPVAPLPTSIIDPRVAQAILQIESGGRTHGENGKPIIRFEAHIFKQYFKNDALWTQHFSVDPAKPWTNQQLLHGFRWLPIHTGNQADEYAAFEFARGLNSEAAYKSISVGAGQIMGFNHARIGYPSARAMFESFQSASMQTIGFINFFLSDSVLVEAMQRKDWREIARRYNGSGQVDHYAKLLREAYEGLE